MSTRLAAFAPVSGAYYIDSSPCHPETVKYPCNATRQDIPFLAFHGGEDDTIPYKGGQHRHECLPAVPQFIREWATRDGLDSQQNTTHSLAANVVTYSFGSNALVQLVYDPVIGHDWPSTVSNADNHRSGQTPASFNATSTIMAFFNQHSLPS